MILPGSSYGWGASWKPGIFPRRTHTPAYLLRIDFGPEIGIRKSSARITELYRRDELEGKLVVAVVNFPPKQIGSVMSECSFWGRLFVILAVIVELRT